MINECNSVDTSTKGATIHEIKRLKPVNTHFNNSLLGIQILSMAKRIMNEIVCLAYDIGCRIFYQDTDSIQYTENLEVVS